MATLSWVTLAHLRRLRLLATNEFTRRQLRRIRHTQPLAHFRRVRSLRLMRLRHGNCLPLFLPP
jgi:hypothetical protein